MKCPICNEELDVYDRDTKFFGNEDIYADCVKCLHTFIFYKRYNRINKYTVWDLEFDNKLNDYVSKENSERIGYMPKKG